MYTTAPLLPIDTINDHTGFFVVGAFCIFLFLINLSFDDYGDGGKFFRGIVITFIAGLAAIISYNTGEYKEYTNTPVDAELVSFWGEGREESYRSGKQTNYRMVHEQFVTYKVPEGLVSFKVQLGQAWPEKAVLYKN